MFMCLSRPVISPPPPPPPLVLREIVGRDEICVKYCGAELFTISHEA